MSSIMARRTTDAAAGATVVVADNGQATGVVGKAAGWQMQLATAQWMSPHSMQQSGERGLVAYAVWTANMKARKKPRTTRIAAG
ncbi:MAG: hypothetical protein EOO26_05585 [Comamonadaceae bacterium]|nr:MAG: hypothetical protein EOO26_05585 [Comamonadaceae bacterium]